MYKRQEQFEFADAYLTELILDPHSILYAELSRNQNCSKYRYYLDPSNPVSYTHLDVYKRQALDIVVE